MRLQIGRIYHRLIKLAALRCQGRENLVEHAGPAPRDEAVADRLRRPVLGWRIAPSQTVPDHEEDAADDPPIIDPRNGRCDRPIGTPLPPA